MRFSDRNFVRVVLPVLGLACGYAYLNAGGAAKSDGVVLPAPTGMNRGPHIVVHPDMQARVGVAFEFLPAVSDVKHVPNFSATNLPAWARLDPATGRVVGTPTTADIGLYESITIAVQDGVQARAETEPFTISVLGSAAAGAGSGVATLEWRIPFSKVDGSPLDDLAGYRIVYGRDQEALDHSIFIHDPAQTSYEFSTLDSGVWYFAIVAVNAGGLEGPPTIPVRKTI